MRITKKAYKQALATVLEYEKQEATPKDRRGKYSILYLLDGDGDEDFRERLISAENPKKAIDAFLKRKPKTLRWVDEDLEMNKQSFYVGDHPGLINYL